MKTGEFEARDLASLVEFVRRFPAYRPLVLCDEDRLTVALRAGVQGMPWRRFLAGDQLT